MATHTLPTTLPKAKHKLGNLVRMGVLCCFLLLAGLECLVRTALPLRCCHPHQHAQPSLSQDRGRPGKGILGALKISWSFTKPGFESELWVLILILLCGSLGFSPSSVKWG